MDELQIFIIGGTTKPFCENPIVNDKQLTMEIGPGAAVTYYREDFEISIPNYLYNDLIPGEHIPVLRETKA